MPLLTKIQFPDAGRLSGPDMTSAFRQWIASERLVPVVRTSNMQDAVDVCSALVAGGLGSLEITLTIPNALKVIESFANRDDVVVGAGSVRNRADAQCAIDAGARFVVTPVSCFDALSYCQERNVPCVLGALTPSEIAAAFDAGTTAVKVFPVSSMGGADYIRSVLAPMPDIPIMVTGGITLANASAYLEAGALAVGVGGELVDVQAVRNGRAADLSQRARVAQAALRLVARS